MPFQPCLNGVELHFSFTHYDSNMAYFHGPWFVNQGGDELVHLINHSFYSREAFISTIQVGGRILRFKTDYLVCINMSVLNQNVIKNHLFSFQKDTNPLLSIVGRCCVLEVSDFKSMRPTHHDE